VLFDASRNNHCIALRSMEHSLQPPSSLQLLLECVLLAAGAQGRSQLSCWQRDVADHHSDVVHLQQQQQQQNTSRHA
jgi:hypothetical protein